MSATKPVANVMVRRKLVGLESIFYRTPEANVVLVARIRGLVEESRLRAALQQVQTLYPLLRAHCQAEQGAVWLVTEAAVELPLRVLARTSDSQWQAAVPEEHGRPFDFEHGPLIRFVLLQSAEVSDLLIFCQHLICDGLSLVNLAETLLKLMSGPSPELKPEAEPALPVPANLPVGGVPYQAASLVKGLFINRFNRQWQAAGMTFSQADLQAVQRAFTEHYRYQLLVAELPEAETSQLVAACRAQQVTVNSALSVAFMAGRQAVLPGYTNPNQGVAVNVRERLKQPVADALGCFVSTLEFKFAYVPATDFWANVRAFHKLVQGRLQEKQDLVSLADISRMSPAMMEGMTFARHVGYSPEVVATVPKLAALDGQSKNIAAVLARDGGANYPGLLITNLGALRYPDSFGALTLEKFFFAPSCIPLSEGGLILGVVTLNQKLVITINARVPQGAAGEAQVTVLDAIKEKAVAQLRKVVAA